MSAFVEKILNNTVENPEQTINTIGTLADLFVKLTPSQQVARSYLIESIKENPNLSGLEKAAMISESKKIIKEFKNKSDVVNKAVDILGPKSEEKIKSVDDEWLSRFLDSVKHVSQEDLQTVWARILANECESPSSVPKALINTLSFLDAKNAKCFSSLCDFVLDVVDLDFSCPIIDRNQFEWLSKFGIKHSLLAELQSFGLIQYGGLGSYVLTAPVIVFSYGDIILRYEWIKESTPPHKDIPVGQVLFTSMGLSLYRAIKRKYHSNFIDYFSRYATSAETRVQKLDTIVMTKL